MAKIVAGQFRPYNNTELSQKLRLHPQEDPIRGVHGIDKLEFYYRENDSFVPPSSLPPGWGKTIRDNRLIPNGSITEEWHYQDSQNGWHAKLVPDRADIEAKKRLLVVTCNPSKPHHKYALIREHDAVWGFVNGMIDVLDGFGFKQIIPESGRVSRFDYAKNFSLNNQWGLYSGVCATWIAKRVMRKKHGDTQVFGNTQKQLALYDKAAEIIQMQNGRSDDLPNSLIRSELRALKSESVERIFRTNNLKELLVGWQGHPNIYNDYLKNNVFTSSIQKKIPYDYSTIESSYELFISRFGKTIGHRRWLQANGTILMAEIEPEMYHHFLWVVIPKYHSRATAYRKRNELAQDIQSFKIQNPIVGDDSWVLLNQELKQSMLIAI